MDLTNVISSLSKPILFAGDFHSVLYFEEKVGVLPAEQASMDDFHNFLSVNSLFDAGYRGNRCDK